MIQEYIAWAKKNGGMTEDQIKVFKNLAHSLGYDEPYGLDGFAETLLQYQTPAAEIIACMRKGLTKRQLESEVTNLGN